jgi:hypothetical protein
MIGVTITAAKEDKRRPAASLWDQPAAPRGWGRSTEAKTRGLARGLIVLAALLLVIGTLQWK